MRTLIFAALGLWGVSSIAQETHDWYAGISLGQFDYDEQILDQSLTDTTEASKLYAGFRYDETWSFEAAYGETGDLEWTESGFIPGVGDGVGTLSGSYEILRAVGIAHFDWFMIGLGYYGVETTASLSVQTPEESVSVSISDDDDGWMATIGAEFDIGERVSMRVEYEWFDSESSVDVSTTGIGVAFKF